MCTKFITLDGIDGAGKTTQLNVVKEWFDEQQRPVLFTREPGGTAVGEALRTILLNPKTEVGLHAETLMMFAARAQHLDEVILPALARGVSVVSDRFTDATFAYQGSGRGLEAEKIACLETWVQQGLQPDLTFILDVPLQISSARLDKSRNRDRFEQEEADFFDRVRSGYLKRVGEAPQRYRVIDSSGDKAAVRAEIRLILDGLFR